MINNKSKMIKKAPKKVPKSHHLKEESSQDSQESEEVKEVEKLEEVKNVKNLIDGKYEVVKRIGFIDTKDILSKQVYLVKCSEEKLMVLKLYTTSENGEFLKESERNLRLPDSPFIIKMVKAVPMRENQPKFVVEGHILEQYSYIIVPYCQHGALINLLLKPNIKRMLGFQVRLYLLK